MEIWTLEGHFVAKFWLPFVLGSLFVMRASCYDPVYYSSDNNDNGVRICIQICKDEMWKIYNDNGSLIRDIPIIDVCNGLVETLAFNGALMVCRVILNENSFIWK